MKQSAIPVHTLTLTALMAAMLCVLGPLSIPIGPVPLSLATLVIYLSVYLLGWKWGLVSVVVYLLVGMSRSPCLFWFRWRAWTSVRPYWWISHRLSSPGRTVWIRSTAQQQAVSPPSGYGRRYGSALCPGNRLVLFRGRVQP